MTRIGRWWRDRSSTERFDLSTRWSMYLLLGMPLFFLTSAMAQNAEGGEIRGGVAAVTVLLLVAHVAVSALLVRGSLARFLGGTARLGGLAAAGVALTLALAVTGGALFTAQDPDEIPYGVLFGIVFAGILAAALSPVLPVPALAGVVVAAMALAAGFGAALGGPGAAASGAVFGFIWVGFMTGTYKFSAWMIGVVWELDRGRAAAARLAVAEERLRFSRDLHDVLGRNLSVIAVKSELAGKLAERGEPGAAAAEMLEVRKVAHDSLREVREVVRGYRTADLEAELAGARSVLRSAGVECRVIGDGSHLPAEVQTALGWVVREATTNVIRHSDATTCTIGLDVRDAGGTAVLRMENDRARAATAAVAEPGVGLAGLAERLAGLGGRLTAGRRPGDLFVVEACVPVTAP
jgi:two-component system sensor histidine kinase DesK